MHRSKMTKFELIFDIKHVTMTTLNLLHIKWYIDRLKNDQIWVFFLQIKEILSWPAKTQ